MIRVSNGDLEALSCLFEKFHVRIFNFSYRMIGNKELSEDITQEVFYHLIRYKKTYNGSSFSTWIYTIARNIIYKEYRNKKPLINNIADMSVLLIDNAQSHNDEIEHLEACLKKLSFEDREIIILNKIEGVKYQELSVIMKTSTGALKTKSHRAMKKLKEFYFNQKRDEIL